MDDKKFVILVLILLTIILIIIICNLITINGPINKGSSK